MWFAEQNEILIWPLFSAGRTGGESVRATGAEGSERRKAPTII